MLKNIKKLFKSFSKVKLVHVKNLVIMAYCFYASQSVAEDKFNKIMNSMLNKDITLEYINGERPFKVFKDGNDWIIEQQENFESSRLESEGGDKISMEEFPGEWPINGTWEFSVTSDECKITHLSESDTTMTWSCPEANKNQASIASNQVEKSKGINWVDRSRIKEIIYKTESGETKKFKVTKITDTYIGFDNYTEWVANFAENGMKPYSPGHSNIETTIVSEIPENFLDSDVGTSLTYKVQEEWNASYGMLWEIQVELKESGVSKFKNTNIETISLTLYGKSIEQNGFNESSWHEVGVSFEESIIIDKRSKILLFRQRDWENRTSNSPDAKQQTMNIEKLVYRDGTEVTWKQWALWAQQEKKRREELANSKAKEESVAEKAHENSNISQKKNSDKSSENKVSSVQNSLSKLGYYKEKVDGILNPHLLSAILSWGKDSGFAFDGNISPALVSILELKASDAEMTKKKAILAKQKEAQKQKEELARKEAAIKRKAEIARKKAQADVARKKLEAEIARKKAEEKRKKELIRKKAEEQRKAKKEKRRLVTQAKNLRKDLLKQRNQLGGLLKDAQKYFKVAEKTPTTLKLMRKVLGAGKVYSAPPPKVISEKAKIGFIKGYISSNTKTIVKYKEAYNLLKENEAFQKFHIKQNAIRKKEIEGQRLVYSANLAYAVEFLFDYISKNMDSKNSEKVLDMIDRLEKEKVEKDLKTLINHNTVLAKELKSLDLTNAYLQFVDAKTKANLAKKKSVKKKPIKKATKVRKTSKQKASKKTKSSEKSSSKPLKKVTRRSAGSGSAKPCEYEYNFNRVFYASQKNYKDFKRTGEAFESYITRADEVGSMFISGKGVCKSKKDDGRNLNKAAEEYRRAIEMGSSLNPKPVPVQKAIKQVKLKACGLSSSLSEEAKILVDEGNHKEAVATYMTAYTKFGNKDAKASLKKYCKKARKNKKLLKVLSKPVVRKSCRAGKGKIQPALRTAEWKKLDGRTPFCP